MINNNYLEKKLAELNETDSITVTFKDSKNVKNFTKKDIIEIFNDGFTYKEDEQEVFVHFINIINIKTKYIDKSAPKQSKISVKGISRDLRRRF